MKTKFRLMKKYYFLLTFLLIIISNGIAQNAVLCSIQNVYIKIENPSNIPTVIDNGDGTVTLTHTDQNITDIFADYIIYDFYQSYPSSNPTGELFKYYTLSHGNKSLIQELNSYANPDVFIIDEIEQYNPTPISPDLIDLLDGKTYNLIKHCSESEESGSICPEDEENVPVGFELKIAFTYNAEKDIVYAETEDLSSCGNYFSVGFKGGYDDGFNPTENTLQLWESENGISTITDYEEPCHYIEDTLYSALDIGCMEANYGNIIINFGTEDGQFVLERYNMIFATNFFTFEEDVLSIEENSSNRMQAFQTKGNPYLQISNLSNEPTTIEIYTLSGQKITNPVKFKNNSVNISHFANGIYFIKLSTLNNQQKVLKFLKN